MSFDILLAVAFVLLPAVALVTGALFAMAQVEEDLRHFVGGNSGADAATTQRTYR